MIPAESPNFLLPIIRQKRSSEFGQLSLLLSLSDWELPPDGSYPSTSIFSCFW